MEPLKPFHNALVFAGKYDGRLYEFLPVNSSWRRRVQRGEALKCRRHVLGGDSPTIKADEAIAATAWPTGGSAGRPTYHVRFYCSVECQRNDAVGLKAGEADETDEDLQ